MKKWKWLLLLQVLVVLGAVFLGVLGTENYIFLKLGGISLQPALWQALIVLFVLYYIVKAVAWFVSGLFGGGWMRKMRERQIATHRTEALKAMLEGNWSLSKSELTRLAKRGENAKYNYLLAARASEKLGNSKDADKLIETARSVEAGDNMAVDLEQVRVHIQRLEAAKALQELNELADRFPKNTEILSLSMRSLVIAQQWAELRQLVHSARKNKVLKDAHHKYEKQLYLQLTRQKVVGNEAKYEHLREIHSEIPKYLITDADLIYALADEYRKSGEQEDAETLLRKTIDSNWDGQLVRLYGSVYTSKIKNQLNVAEKWLRKHQSDVDLLLTLEELCQRAEQWEKAKHYAMLARGESTAETASPDSVRVAPITEAAETAEVGTNSDTDSGQPKS